MHVSNGKGSITRLIAGILILASVVLGYYFSEYFYFFAGFVGFMLTLSALTGICPMATVLKALGFPEKENKGCCC